MTTKQVDLTAIDALLIGVSLPVQHLRAAVAQAARSPLPVLVHGPTGAGKELVALAIHSASRRRGAFVPFNVSAIPDTMFADTLFGHVRGAFTGAITATPGYLREADHGTVFLDEIGGLSMANQMALLRVLETRAYRPLGAAKDQRSDFRIVAATNDDLVGQVKRREFRQDLLFRLQAIRIDVPPLGERLEDIPHLVRHFITMLALPGTQVEFTAAALQALQAYHWPGNIRELRHVVEAAYYLADTHVVDAQVVALALQERCAADRQDEVAATLSAKRTELVAALERYANDVGAVAAHYGCTKTTIYRWLQEHRIPTPKRRGGPRTARARPSLPEEWRQSPDTDPDRGGTLHAAP